MVISAFLVHPGAFTLRHHRQVCCKGLISMKKAWLRQVLSSDSVFSLIWEADCDDGTPSGFPSGSILRVQP